MDDWQLTWRIEQERKKCFISFHTILERMFDVWVECRDRRSVARQTSRMIQQLGADMMDRINRLTCKFTFII